MNFSRLLVTGGLGFIGSNFIHHMFHKFNGTDHSKCCPEHEKYPHNGDFIDFEIMNVDCLTYAGKKENLAGIDHLDNYYHSNANITDFEKMNEVFESFRPTAIIHFAAESHVDRSISSGLEFVKSNVLGTQILLDLARRFDVELFFHISTDEVYGSMDEGVADEQYRLFPSSPYSASKASSDLLVLSHFHTYGTPVIISRCSNNFGPRQHEEKLVPKMISKASEDQELPIYGSGKQIRNWIHVKDHCEAIVMLMKHGKIGEIYNIAGDEEVSNIDLVRNIIQSLGRTESLIKHVEDRPGHDFRYGLDGRKLRKMGWSPKINLKDGLDDLIS